MLQQTRVEAATGYYLRFLERFPNVEALAVADEAAVLTAWSGLGYYSRARNLQRAARQVVESGLPATHAEVLALPGIGPYTAAALASISLGLQHAAVDGNVVRVVSRLTNDDSESSSPAAKRRFAEEAQALLDPARPGDFNQAMMELGATVCVPRAPRCSVCPVSCFCRGLEAGRQNQLPVRLRAATVQDVKLDLVLLEQGADIFLVQRPGFERRLAGFWELPQKKLLPGIRLKRTCAFEHRIVNDRFHVTVWRGRAGELPEGGWFGDQARVGMPLSTITKKALRAAAALQLRPVKRDKPVTPGFKIVPVRD